MRTAFTFEDDKELVQLALTSSGGGSRISWSDIAQRMRRSGHPASALKKRLQPRGRRPEVIRQLRAAPSPRDVPSPEILICDLAVEAEPSARHDETAATATDGSEVIGATSESGCARAESCDVKPLRAGDEALVQESSSLPSSVADEVAAIIANVPMQLVMNDQNEPHRNAGELMPDGINSLLDEIGSIDEHDLFLDIGAGVGNVVAHVALRTRVLKAICIELCEDICRAGVSMMMSSSHSGLFSRRTEMICKNVADVSISYTPPFALATIVYWNNVLFEPRVIEYVMDQLCDTGMFAEVISAQRLSL
ncbi:hypothetical protein F444_01951 [Phytophthora nicotianae P1976]|uniref:DOT1 domain-containing protein n=1 Tax=Phytophthora nicotianae P1976 TaxID=1317066 RepID=A0A081AYZ9_PHYNI|nr:hypothetical protein F444_01951 [Phytophthora nicotianae P1976]